MEAGDQRMVEALHVLASVPGISIGPAPDHPDKWAANIGVSDADIDALRGVLAHHLATGDGSKDDLVARLRAAGFDLGSGDE